VRYVVTGSSGHLGEGLVRVLRGRSADVVSVDIKPGPYTDHIGTITDRAFVAEHTRGADIILHAATLHKPHVATHSRQDFVDVNITGTLNLLEASLEHRVSAFVFTSTTSTFGDALVPEDGEPAAWITEDVIPSSKNIYGSTKLAAEDLCWLFHRRYQLPCMILRTSRFFPEEQDDPDVRSRYTTENSQVIEFLHRRVDLEDAVAAHILAAERAPQLGFGRYIISATTPFLPRDLADLRSDAAGVVRKYVDYEAVFEQFGWSMYTSIDRVYVNARAQRELGWKPVHDFGSVLRRVAKGGSALSDLANAVGSKGYHDQQFKVGPYPIDNQTQSEV